MWATWEAAIPGSSESLAASLFHRSFVLTAVLAVLLVLQHPALAPATAPLRVLPAPDAVPAPAAAVDLLYLPMDLAYVPHAPLRDDPAPAPQTNGKHAPWDDTLYDHRRVLLMSAVQHAMLTMPSAVPNHASVGKNIDRILATARAAHHPPLIIHIRNIGDPGDADEKGTPGWELVYTPLPHEPVLDKTKNNAFAGTHLHEWICPEAEIVIVGMQSDFCISATCKAALDRGNTVIMIKGAHATSDRLEVSAPITPATRIEKQVENEMEELGVVLLDMSDLDDLFTDR